MAFAIVLSAVITIQSVSMPRSRTRVSTSSPARPGMRMSSSATSKRPVSRAAQARVPSATLSTVCPRLASACSRTQRSDSSSSATRTLPVCSVVDVFMGGYQGEGHAEGGAATGARLVRDRAGVLGHDAMTDRKAEAAAAGFGREEGGEEQLLDVGRDAGARVADHDRREHERAFRQAHLQAGLDARADV